MTDMPAVEATLRDRANELVQFLVTQPPKRMALRAAMDFAWWCVGRGAEWRGDFQKAGRLPAAATTGQSGPEQE